MLLVGTGLEAGLCIRDPEWPGPRAPVLARAPRLYGAGRIGEAVAVDPGERIRAVRLDIVWPRDDAPISSAAGPVYAPAPGDDCAALVARATDAGRAVHDMSPITITYLRPVLSGAPPDIDHKLIGPRIVDISPFFSASSLSFSIAGDGVSIDSATGVVTIGAVSLLAGVSVVVTAAGAGGQAEASFHLKVTPVAPSVLAVAPVLVVAPVLAGTGLIGAALEVDPGAWDGEPDPELTLQWLCDGAPVIGATGPSFTPDATQDGAVVACRVTARNAAGEALAETEAVLVVYAAPVVLGAPADVVFAQGAGAGAVPMADAFTGAALRFAVTGAGAGIDSGTGVVSIPTGVVRTADVVAVTATNSGGSATQSFAASVLATPVAVGTPAVAAFARGAGSASVSMQAFFGGTALVYALVGAPAGVTINAGSGLVTVATTAVLAATVVVQATNAVGSVTQSFAVSVLATPVAAGTPAVAAFAQGARSASVSMQAFFGGTALAYALEAAPAGVTINAGSGLVTVATTAVLAGTVVVRATNAVGSATQSFAVTVYKSASVFDVAAALTDMQFVFRTAAPSWTLDAGGFARLVPAANSDRAHGNWALARGDGRYRCLLRSSPVTSSSNDVYAFGFIGRMTKTGTNFLGVRAEAVLRATSVRALEIRQYTGVGGATSTLAATQVPWEWDAWHWLEMEFDGDTLRARLYPEADPAPAWQLTRKTTHLAAGAFGPSAYATFGQRPNVDIRRLEYRPLAAAQALAAQTADWAIDQIVVQI